jgi:hypothetical protein
MLKFKDWAPVIMKQSWEVVKGRFKVRSQNCEKRLLAPPYLCPSAWNNARPTGRILMEFEIYLSIFRKSAVKAKDWLNSDKNNICFTWRQMHIFDSVSLHYFRENKYFGHTCRENQNTHI